MAADGCPCNGNCCDEPQIHGGHDDFCECDDSYCDYNWVVGCLACGDQCGCEV